MTRFWMAVWAAVGLAAISFSADSASSADPPAKPITIDFVKDKPVRSGSLGTKGYTPSEKEAPFFKRLDKDEVATGGFAGDYDIAKKDKKYVGWFGVIREVKEDKEKNETTLLVEHKYFDGLTDVHILALSFNGSGDYQVVVPGTGLKLQKLALIKTYGTVAGPADNSPPKLNAEFVRHWEWGTFTFLMASGDQRGSEKWRKLNRVDLDDIYQPYPDDKYYEERLGKRPVEKAPE